MHHWLGFLLSISSRASTWLRYHQEMHIFSLSIVSQNSIISTFSNWDSLLVASYGMTVVNTLISFGLLLLYMPSYRIWDWNPPFRAPKTIIFIYFLSNLFLVIVPFFPPASRTYEKLPYWVCFFSFYVLSRLWFRVSQSHSMGSVIVTFLGITYWYIWGTWLPKRNGYRLQREWVIEEDGVSRYVFRRVPWFVLSPWQSTWAIDMGGAHWYALSDK